MEAGKLKLIIQNTLNTKDGYELIKFIIEESNCFDRSVSYDTNKQYYLQGKKDFGAYIAMLIQTHDFNKYVEIIRKD